MLAPKFLATLTNIGTGKLARLFHEICDEAKR